MNAEWRLQQMVQSFGDIDIKAGVGILKHQLIWKPIKFTSLLVHQRIF